MYFNFLFINRRLVNGSIITIGKNFKIKKEDSLKN